jgi:hypothetical protein
VAHVDTPKGDLDGSNDGVLSGSDVTTVIGSDVYPFGTTEQYPQISDSNGVVLFNSAHEYRECSNKGHCDRTNGVCECFVGYEGSACQFMSCPVDDFGKICSGHGVCSLAEDMARSDSGNIYKLWDNKNIQGCVCDAGYSGASCSERVCKKGVDPLFIDRESSFRFANWSYVIHTKSSTANIQGNYSLVFYDETGEDWATAPIDAESDCAMISAVLENLPNNVIKKDSVLCVQWRSYNTISKVDEPILLSPNPYYGIKTTLAFPSNPGILKQLELRIHLDGIRPTLFSSEPNAPVSFFIYPDGFSGESTEYFSEKCVGVDVSIQEYLSSATPFDADASGGRFQYLGSLTPHETRLLARCLGEADGVEETPDGEQGTGRVQGQSYTWDYGTYLNPHVIRLVEQTSPDDIVTDLCPGLLSSTRGSGVVCRPFTEMHRHPGFFVALFYDPEDDKFKMFTRPGLDYSPLTFFAVFTTRGTAQMVSSSVRVYTSPQFLYSKRVYTTLSNRTVLDSLSAKAVEGRWDSGVYDGALDCESNGPNVNGAFDCLEKGDKVFFLDPALSQRSFLSNPKYLNLYQVAKISRTSLADSGIYAGFVRPEEYYTGSSGRNQIVLDMSINNAWSFDSKDNARAYVFRPPVFAESVENTGGYIYVSECSNRGSCSRDSGLCTCFVGFDGDNCDTQNTAFE